VLLNKIIFIPGQFALIVVIPAQAGIQRLLLEVMMKRFKIFLLLAVTFTLLISVTSCYAAGPWRGKVIDADTKQPIEGAAVVAVWQKEWAGLGAGADTNYLDASETVTDKNGDFEIPAKSFLSVPYFRKVKGPLFTVFKPGYGSFPNFQKKPLEIPAEYFLSERGIVELPKLMDYNKRYESLSLAEVLTDVPKNKIQHFRELINIERKNLNLPVIPKVNK
jgi:hypothetical protein